VDVSDYQAQLADTKRLAALRNGRLPSIQTSRFLESGELCHWIGACVFVWQTSTKSKNARGELIVTSERIIFTSPNKSFEFTPSKIVDIQAFTNAVVLASSGSKGAGTYLIEDAAILEAVLVGVVRKHKYLASESFSSSKTRHIPDSVKREVWFRDGGKCVRCESQQYLEFDHIIPHAKGGANTVNNVQLLCRACNALKSDRI
ncbi:MAG: HNH endonuclease, partial [Planctomycetes bacterium]|nr:HNH endonuclease [Planctomycetota bacterium]